MFWNLDSGFQVTAAMPSNHLHSWADWASIATFVVTFISAMVGICAYIKYRQDLHRKSQRLEQYLRDQKVKGGDRGQRSVIQIVRDVGLTEDEIIQASFRNPRVARRVKLDEDGLAKQLLFEYVD